MKFADAVETELERARSIHTKRMSSAHEGYAVIAEEVDEFWELVKQLKPSNRELLKEKMLEELVQIAAMAQKTAEDLGLIF